MKAENRGKKTKKNRKLTVQCTICGTDMACPDSMQSADGHFCARCTDLMAQGYEPEELKKSHEDNTQHFEKCEEISIQLMDIAFDSYWNKVQELDKERIEIVGKLREFIKKHTVEKAILFGSFARGEAREDSDIDLILVSKEFEGKSSLKRPVPFYLDWHLGYPVDFLCYTPKEFNDLRKQVSIVSQALKEGIEIV